jgi:hypothetical protein
VTRRNKNPETVAQNAGSSRCGKPERAAAEVIQTCGATILMDGRRLIDFPGRYCRRLRLTAYGRRPGVAAGSRRLA